MNEPTLKNLGRRVFFLVWGSMFGCMPLVFGLENGLQGGLPMLAAQIAVLVTAIAVPFFWLDSLREAFSNKNVVLIGFGGVFFIAGMGAGSLMLHEGVMFPALLVGGLFVLVGGGMFLWGLRGLLHGSPED